MNNTCSPHEVMGDRVLLSSRHCYENRYKLQVYAILLLCPSRETINICKEDVHER